MSDRRVARRADQSVVDDLLKGAIDMHVHHAPDAVARKADAIELAAQARDAGMGGLVLKCHNAPTAALAYVLGHQFPEIHVFGGIATNSALGGLNPEAVSVALRMGAKVVWLPTLSALNHVRVSAGIPYYAEIGGGSRSTGITLVGEDGKLKPEVLEIMRLVKDADAVLETGHSSVHEIELVVDAAAKMGLGKVVLTHPEFAMIDVPISVQKELADKGAYFERDYGIMVTPINARRPDEYAEAIRVVGVQSTVMGSDLGQPTKPYPLEGLRSYIAAMLEEGISERDIEIMVKHNPAQLLGVKAA